MPLVRQSVGLLQCEPPLGGLCMQALGHRGQDSGCRKAGTSVECADAGGSCCHCWQRSHAGACHKRPVMRGVPGCCGLHALSAPGCHNASSPLNAGGSCRCTAQPGQHASQPGSRQTGVEGQAELCTNRTCLLLGGRCPAKLAVPSTPAAAAAASSAGWPCGGSGDAVNVSTSRCAVLRCAGAAGEDHAGAQHGQAARPGLRLRAHRVRLFRGVHSVERPAAAPEPLLLVNCQCTASAATCLGMTLLQTTGQLSRLDKHLKVRSGGAWAAGSGG